MPRPLPDPKEAARRGKIVAALIGELGGKAAASRALGAAGLRAPTPDTLYKYVNGALAAPEGLIADLQSLCDDRPRWLTARDGKRRLWLIHNHAPGFTARIVNGDLADIRWHSGEPPPARAMGDLLKAASAQIEGT